MTFAAYESLIPKTWESVPVHPAAEKLPMMSDAELDELAQDIKRNGLQEPVVLWVDNREDANGNANGPFPIYLLDGRNRLAALRRLGINHPNDAPRPNGVIWTRVELTFAIRQMSGSPVSRGKVKWAPATNPETFVISANVHRRHLTPEQRHDAIADYIKNDPEASDREIARKVKADHNYRLRDGRGFEAARRKV
jgi:hypothetical protein